MYGKEVMLSRIFYKNKAGRRLMLYLSAVLLVVFSLLFLPGRTGIAAGKPSLSARKISISVNESFKLKVKNTDKYVKWTSSNPDVAVYKKGAVVGKAQGKASITAKVSGKSLVCKVVVRGYTFRYPDYLEEHFEKHGSEMGFASKEAYLKAANAVITNKSALHKLEAEDSDHVYYVEATNEIVFLSGDGYIRTYFVCDGKDYFDRQ